MPLARRFTLIGTRPTDEPGWFDAFDAVVELDDDSLVCFGARTPEALNAPSRPNEQDTPWGDYVAWSVTLDFSSVRYYDFNTPLWLGPEPHACLVWTNATALNVTGVGTILRYANMNTDAGVLSGPEGAGLPSPAELQVTLSDDAEWHDVPSHVTAKPVDQEVD